MVTGSGMAALALALVSQLRAGDHVVVSNQLYGRSLALFTSEAARLGIDSTAVDTCDLAATEAAFASQTRLLVVETITNPMLRVSDIAALSQLAQAHGVPNGEVGSAGIEAHLQAKATAGAQGLHELVLRDSLRHGAAEDPAQLLVFGNPDSSSAHDR